MENDKNDNDNNDKNEKLIVENEDDSEDEAINSYIRDIEIIKHRNKTYNIKSIIKDLIMMGFDKEVIQKCFVFNEINSIEYALTLLSKENNIWQHKFIKQRKSKACLICKEDIDHIDYKVNSNNNNTGINNNNNNNNEITPTVSTHNINNNISEISNNSLNNSGAIFNKLRFYKDFTKDNGNIINISPKKKIDKYSTKNNANNTENTKNENLSNISFDINKKPIHNKPDQHKNHVHDHNNHYYDSYSSGGDGNNKLKYKDYDDYNNNEIGFDFNSAEKYNEDNYNCNDESKLSKLDDINEDIKIKSNKSNIVCEICLTEYMPDEFFSLSCYHRYCEYCWSDYLEEKINNANIEKITCMLHGCPFEVYEDDITYLCKYDTCVKYLKFKENLKVLKDKNKKFCPFPNCKSFVELKEPLKSLKDKTKYVTCSDSHNFCFNCLGDWHGKVNCNKMMDKSLKNYIKEKMVKKCPKCGVLT